MFLYVASAKPLDDYRIEVCLDDEREGIADIAEALEGSMFGLLKDPEVFRKSRVDEERQTIVWPNGADLAPEDVYYRTFRGDREFQATFCKWGYIV